MLLYYCWLLSDLAIYLQQTNEKKHLPNLLEEWLVGSLYS
jgi:hypothetical protein